jgi:hypothetical protein
MTTTLTERQQYYLDRLDANVCSAQSRLDVATVKVEAARAAGVDTSTFDPRTSACSADFSLRKLQGGVDQAIKNYEAYVAQLAAKGVEV